MIFDVPTKEEFKEIIENYPFDESLLSLENFQYTVHPENSHELFFASNQIQTWQIHLSNRMYQTRTSWLMLNHLFNKGIPDDEWYISPGRKGHSVEYFPHFEDKDWQIKSQFDYFSDVFYYKLFSAWDNLGHLLNNMYDLEIKKPDFHRAVEQLKGVRPDLHSNLGGLINSEDFQKMKEFRHSSTHNELVGHVGSRMAKFSTETVSGISFGVGEYTTSSQIKNNADESLKLLTGAIKFIKEQVRIDSV